jgi:hypothetical protein
MYLDFEPGEDTFDRQVYKEYTQMGTKVKFLVWPALFLHKGGALISKGVLVYFNTVLHCESSHIIF